MDKILLDLSRGNRDHTSFISLMKQINENEKQHNRKPKAKLVSELTVEEFEKMLKE